MSFYLNQRLIRRFWIVLVIVVFAIAVVEIDLDRDLKSFQTVSYLLVRENLGRAGVLDVE